MSNRSEHRGFASVLSVSRAAGKQTHSLAAGLSSYTVTLRAKSHTLNPVITSAFWMPICCESALRCFGNAPESSGLGCGSLVALGFSVYIHSYSFIYSYMDVYLRLRTGSLECALMLLRPFVTFVFLSD